MSYSCHEQVRKDRYSYWPDDPEPASSDWCIYTVPHSIRKGKEEAHTQIVSVGPLHCDNKELTDVDQLKWRYVKKFFERTARKPEEVLDVIKARKQRIRDCYSETSNLESHKYVRMILGDAIFILGLLLGNFEEDECNKLLWIPADKLALKLDLLLLENQLPYFLLEELYNSIVSSPSFIEICLKFFRSLFFDSAVSGRNDFKHFTDMLRCTLVQHFPADEYRPFNYEVDNLNPLPCATKLQESAVKCTPISLRRLLEVRFEGGELKMPLFLVHHQTETVFRNITVWSNVSIHVALSSVIMLYC